MSDYGHDEVMRDLGLDPVGDHHCINCDGLPKAERMRCIERWPTHNTKYRDRIAAYIGRLEADHSKHAALFEAAKAHMEAWDVMDEALEERFEAMYESSHGQVITDSYLDGLTTRIREAHVVERRTAEALQDALSDLEASE